MSPDLNPVQKSMARFESSNKLSVTEKPSGIRTCNIEEWKKISEKTCSNLIKKLRKQSQLVIKMRDHPIDYEYCENCWIFHFFILYK